MKKRIFKSCDFQRSTFSLSNIASGFTLLEVLIALVVLAITVSAVLESEIVSLNIERKARILQIFRFETVRISSLARRAANWEELAKLLPEGTLCRVTMEPAAAESSTGSVDMVRFRLFSGGGPSLSEDFFAYPPGLSPSNAPRLAPAR